MYLSKEKAKELLEKGNSLTAPGKNLDTLEKVGENEYSWEGKEDQEPTYLTWEEVEGMIHGVNWEMNLLD